MEDLRQKMLCIAERLNQALSLKSKREISKIVEGLHVEMAPVYMFITPENGFGKELCDISMELMIDIRWGRQTSVDKKLSNLCN
ncbi:hypothetical protein [Trabulsiella guamensis]|uniref:hypothetical protein n=1 Tax=Trabulsiella guamensis TaxID=158852 RepID=UPI00056EF483|nr:hypothetical protein [Trabulsiella guamensis]